MMTVEQAHAKINLYLDVIGRRADGYHLLESVMVPLALHDTLTLTLSEDYAVSLTCQNNPTKDPNDNLVTQVAVMMQHRYGLKGMNIELVKRIPVAAGLGGGSADAAATLRAINRAFNLGLSRETLAELGLPFGADIPFCVHERPAFVQGIGERLTFLKPWPKTPVSLFTPPFFVSTAAVFKRVSRLHPTTQNPQPFLEAWQHHDPASLRDHLYNALTEITMALYPKLRAFKQRLDQTHPMKVHMSGSGPTFFLFGEQASKTALNTPPFSLCRFTTVTTTL